MAIDLSALDPDQRAAATAPRGPVAILAGAGTGKTRTITYRIAHLIDQGFVSPQRVLAVTFTNRAAGEMRARLAALGIPGVQARTFHSAAMRQLSYFWPQVYGTLPWKLLDNKFPLVARAARAVGLPAETENIRDLLAEIEWAKSAMIAPSGYAQATSNRTLPAPADQIAQAYAAYEEAKSSSQGYLLDFDDLLMHTAGALENSSAIAEAFREQYRTFVVDEYQDVTPLQQRVLNAWLGERDDLTVVGDANQTIYSFTGATPEYLLGFSKTYPHATVVRLERDYRSTPQITDLANAVISHARGRAAGSRLSLQGMRPSGPQPQFMAYDDEPAEAKEVAKQVRSLIRKGVETKEIAILFRVNAQSAAFEQALAELNIPYQVRGGEEFFKRTEIRQALTALTRLVDTPGDLPALIRNGLAPLGLTSTEPSGAQARERWQSLKAFEDLCRELILASPNMTLEALIQQLQERASAKHPPTLQGVTLASLHAAKGLEWDAVFLVGLTEGMLPIRQAIQGGDDAVEEERRLFYVGVTRAREHLVLTWSKSRHEGGRANKKRSRFVDDVAPPVESVPSRRTPTKRRCRVCSKLLHTSRERILGHCESCPTAVDEKVLDALRAWRLDTSKAQNIPAYLIFTDATLLAVAEAMPKDQAGLLDIPGIGLVKLERYGNELLEILNSMR